MGGKMFKNVALKIGLAVLVLFAGIPIAQAEYEQEKNWCYEDTSDPDLSIGACTRLIQAGI